MNKVFNHQDHQAHQDYNKKNLVVLVCLVVHFFSFSQLSFAEEPAPSTYQPEFCEFSVTFPEEPYTTRRCDDDGGKLKRQLAYAEKKGIPYVWFPPFEKDGKHEVKNMASHEQVKADPDTWKPDE